LAKPDPFSRNVSRNWVNVLTHRSWITLKTFLLCKFLRRPLTGDTGLIGREENDRMWNKDYCVLCNHMLNIVINKGLRSLAELVPRQNIGYPTFHELYRIPDNWLRFLRLILKPWAAPRRIRPIYISESRVSMIASLIDDDWYDMRESIWSRNCLLNHLFSCLPDRPG
jgi:hypothetical protein